MHLNAPFEVPHTMPVLRQYVIVCSPHIDAILIPSLQTPAVALTRSERGVLAGRWRTELVSSTA